MCTSIHEPHPSISNRASNWRRAKYFIMLLHTSHSFYFAGSKRRTKSPGVAQGQWGQCQHGQIKAPHWRLFALFVHLWFLSNFYLLDTQVTKTWLRVLKSGLKRILLKCILWIKVKHRGILESHWQDNVFSTHLSRAHFPPG